MSRPSSVRSAGVALAAAAALAGAASVASATPPSQFDVQPASVNFGTVPLGMNSVKPVTMINRTKDTLYYDGAWWPNFSNPGLSYPYGIWNISDDPFPCYVIEPRASCTLMFRFTPSDTGKLTAHFTPSYTPDWWTDYSDRTDMRGTGVAPPPA